jgi:hypothetical protein
MIALSSHKERREHRERVALYAEQHGIDAAAVAFQTHIHTVYLSCREFGKKPFKPKGGLKLKTLSVLHRLLTTDLPYKAIGEEFGVTRQRVEQIAADAVQAGFKIRNKEAAQ